MPEFKRLRDPENLRNKTYLPREGHIRLGYRDETKNNRPVETPYFVVPESIQSVYGPQPKELQVYLPSRDEYRLYEQKYVCYGANQKRLCHGDGETYERIIKIKSKDDNGKDISIAQKEYGRCPTPENCEYGQEHRCAARMKIFFAVRGLTPGALYQLSTGSISSDIDIRSGINQLKDMFNGRFWWIRCKLVREEKKIPHPQTGAMITHYPVKLIPDVTEEEMRKVLDEEKWEKMRGLPPKILQLPSFQDDEIEETDTQFIPPSSPQQPKTYTLKPESEKAQNKPIDQPQEPLEIGPDKGKTKDVGATKKTESGAPEGQGEPKEPTLTEKASEILRLITGPDIEEQKKVFKLASSFKSEENDKWISSDTMKDMRISWLRVCYGNLKKLQSIGDIHLQCAERFKKELKDLTFEEFHELIKPDGKQGEIPFE